MYFGSKEWANDLMRTVINICKKKYSYEVLPNRIAEIEAYINMQKKHGFWWQSERSSEYLSRMKANHKGIKPSPHTEFIKPKIIFVPQNTDDFLFWLYNLDVNIRYVTKRHIYISISLK